MKRFTFPLLYIWLPVWMLTACSLFNGKKDKDKDSYSEHRTQMEKEAQQRLATARDQLKQGTYDKARATINRMRHDCYLAIDGRRQGILLMDSIDLADSRSQLVRIDSAIHAGVDSVGKGDFDEACRKVEFYERKLKHDSESTH